MCCKRHHHEQTRTAFAHNTSVEFAMPNMMSHRTSYCHKDRPRKQCITSTKLKNKYPRRGRCLIWRLRVADDVRETTHRHVMHFPHQQQWMTRHKSRSPRHFSKLPRGNPRQERNEWKNSRRGTARKKIACVASRCPPRVWAWTTWTTMFYLTSHKNVLKFNMFSHVHTAFFPCLTWRILGDVPEKNFHVKADAHNHFFWHHKKQRFLIVLCHPKQTSKSKHSCNHIPLEHMIVIWNNVLQMVSWLYYSNIMMP